ncbi:hypothetical protein FDP22_12475 [Paroceanicella profunda]|uniref:Uncharacterized protein n=1 Tax=Paroceanicella profunda TaxID=2579971 RepID=A0A5B8G1V1_9RHOB|nr:hypothetical protein [Paroceanicella profunda]QDL92523.1 hypothetical protein FDP22_12475 [Paroceanicella profunda]
MTDQNQLAVSGHTFEMLLHHVVRFTDGGQIEQETYRVDVQAALSAVGLLLAGILFLLVHLG